MKQGTLSCLRALFAVSLSRLEYSVRCSFRIAAALLL